MKRKNNKTSRSFTGALGNVIISSWKETDYVRVKPSSNKKYTEKQLAQQARFGVAMNFARHLTDLVMVTFKENPNKTGMNLAVSYILRKAITGTYPDYSLDYSEVLISRGGLPHARQVVASSDSRGAIRFSWTNQELLPGKAKLTDQVVMAAYCPELKRAQYRLGASRSALTDTLMVRGFKGKTVHTWITFLSKDQSDVADSVYMGEVIVME